MQSQVLHSDLIQTVACCPRFSFGARSPTELGGDCIGMWGMPRNIES